MSTKHDHKLLRSCCLVHPSWTVAGQALLWRAVGIWDPNEAEQILASPAFGRYNTANLTIYGGKNKRKIAAERVNKVLGQSGPVERLTVHTVTDLTANSFFAAGNLLSNLTHLDINMAVKDLSKNQIPIVCPSPIPLKTVTLGGQSVAPTFLEPLFAASTATLTTLSITLNPRTTPNLIKACPTALPHITQLNVDSLRNEITHVERAFFPLLAACANLRSLGWEWMDFFQLEGATRHLPDQGGRLERISIGLFGPPSKAARVKGFLKQSACLSLRELVVIGAEIEREAVRRVCAERRVLLG